MMVPRFFPSRSVIFGTILFLLVGSCKEDEVSPLTEEEIEIRNYLVDVVKYWYLWNDQVPEVNVHDYATMEDLMDALAIEPLDRWSYVTDEVSFDQYYASGEYVGVGISMQFDQHHELRVSLAYPNSPAEKAGLVRGTKVLKINGIIAVPSADIDKAFGGNVAGSVANLQVQGLDGTTREVSLTKVVIDLETVLHQSVREVGGKKVGYLVFNHFIERSKEDLKAAFQYFAAQNIEELVVDLRYNGGGLVSIAQYLAGLIVNQATTGQVLSELRHNKGLYGQNVTNTFDISDVPISLSRVVFLVAGGSASASELLVNGLKPYMPVTCIGTRTYGKPVGSYGFRHKGYIISPIAFKVVNSQGSGDYFEGIGVDSYIPDDLSRNFGDSEEAMFKEALKFIETGELSNSGARISPTPDPNLQLLRGFRAEMGVW